MIADRIPDTGITRITNYMCGIPANAWLIPEPGHSGAYWLVDTGWPEVALPDRNPMLQTVEQAAALNGELNPRLTGVVITHRHSDHVGNLYAMIHMKCVDAPFWQNARFFIPSGDDKKHLRWHWWQITDDNRNGISTAVKTQATASLKRCPQLTGPDQAAGELERIDPGPVFTRVDEYLPFEACHTPGHTDGHISLLLREQRAICCGDVCMNIWSSGLSGPLLLSSQSLAQNRVSMMALFRMARDSNVRRILSGHGEPLTDPESWPEGR